MLATGSVKLEVSGLVIAFPGAPPVLTVPALSFGAGSAVAISGPSGAGKSSLLHALAGIERPASGSVYWGGENIWAWPSRIRDRWRRERVGLVFQDMHLLTELSALDNVLLPVCFDHARVPAAMRERGLALLNRLGVTTPHRRASVMSRGERQRVAIARALLRGPSVLIADEPTASLDAAAAAAVGGLLLEVAGESGATLLVATHDVALLARLPERFGLGLGAMTRLTRPHPAPLPQAGEGEAA